MFFFPAVPSLSSSQLGIRDNSEDVIYSEGFEEVDDPNDETYSPGLTSDSMKSTSCSEQSLEIKNVRIYLDLCFPLRNMFFLSFK